MADNRPYYYMRLKEGFFDSDELIALQSMKDGYLYSDILLKLYLRSLRQGGRLMVSDCIPYDAEMISRITKHNKKIVEKALVNFKKLGLIEILDSGAIYMTDIQEYIGKSSTEADRKRDYRNRIEAEKHGQMSGHLSAKRPPELELEKELEKELEYSAAAAASQTPTVHTPPTFSEVEEFCRGKAVDAAKFFNHYEATGWKVKDGQPIRNWRALIANWEKTERPKADPEPQHTPSYGSAAQYDDMDPDWLQAAEAQQGDSATG